MRIDRNLSVVNPADLRALEANRPRDHHRVKHPTPDEAQYRNSMAAKHRSYFVYRHEMTICFRD
jgi:hypothetical protein